MSKIEWTQQTWNPIVGCSIVSPGCTNCYAMRMAARIDKITLSSHYEGLTKKVNGKFVWTGKLAIANNHILRAPLARRIPTMYFVNSMGDLFHEGCPEAWIKRVFATMALCPRHTFQILTKRPQRMLEFVNGRWDRCLPNVWLGVSCERQQEADERIPLLLQTSAAVRFISAEPLLGPIDLTAIKRTQAEGFMRPLDGRFNNLDWVIVGGESGPGARPMHPEWARSLRNQCITAGVPFFFKQWGEWAPTNVRTAVFGGKRSIAIDLNGNVPPGDPMTSQGADEIMGALDAGTYCHLQCVGKKAAGRVLDGHEYNEMPTPYDAQDDMTKSIGLGFKTIRERMAAGGPG